MKRVLCALLSLFVLAFAAACGRAPEKGPGGETYVWEKEGFGGDFTLTLNEDGTYSYYEGYLSSYVGTGNWTEENGVVTLKETGGYAFVFHFAAEDGALVFIKEGSSEFIYTDVENKDRFMKRNEKPETPEIPDLPEPRAMLLIEAGERKFYASFEDNPSALAFRDKLKADALTVDVRDYGGFEKVGSLPWDLPRTDREIDAKPGDLILYQGDQITLYYGENTWNFTRLARIGNVTREELLAALGEGDATLTFSLEWSE